MFQLLTTCNQQDLNLPKSIVTRLAKGVLPANTQIQGNAMLAMTKSATVFVNYLATQFVSPFNCDLINAIRKDGLLIAGLVPMDMQQRAIERQSPRKMY